MQRLEVLELAVAGDVVVLAPAATGGLPEILYRRTELRLFGKYALSEKSALRLDARLREAVAQGRTVVAVLHERHPLPELFDQVLALEPDAAGGPARCRSWGPVRPSAPQAVPWPCEA